MSPVLIIEQDSLFASLCAQQLGEWLAEAPIRHKAAAIAELDLSSFSHILLETGSAALSEFPLAPNFLSQLRADQHVLAIGPAMNVVVNWYEGKQRELREWLLGHQADCIVGGGKHRLLELFPRQFPAIFYQKWAIEEMAHADWVITARNPQQQILAIRHKSRPWEAVQFQPCSWAMPERSLFWKNWLEKDTVL